MLLPIRDSVDGAIGFKVFEQVENYLKDSDWCYYRSNSEILNIFSNYQRNLDNVLKDKKVLKIVSEKTKTGSLIDVRIINEIKGVDLRVKVIGANGEDILFKEETKLTTDDYVVIGQTVKNWLELYEKSIPYDGRIIGVLGNQFTVDMGQSSGVKAQSEVIISRPTRKKRHPLLKEVVDWETKKIGSGKIFHMAKNQSQGRILQYDTKQKLKVEDWVILKESTKENYIEQKKFDDKNDYEFGKLGTVSLNFNIGKASAASNRAGERKIGGAIFGLELDTSLWITRNYWVELDIGRKVGSLEQEEGNVSTESNSLSLSKFDLKIGYKYLPLGFFYGPQVDAFIGYSSYSYGLDDSQNDGFTDFGFKGILLGFGGSLPLQNAVRIKAEFSFLLSPGYSEELSLFGADDSVSTYNIDFGGSYLYSPTTTIDFSYAVTSARARFESGESIRLKDSILRVGATFNF